MTKTRTAALAPLIAMLLALAACGSAAADTSATGAELPTLETADAADGSTDDADEDATDGDAEEADGPVDPEIAMAEYERCLADEGIELPSMEDGDGAMVLEFEAAEGGDGEPGDPEAFEAAFEKCDELLTDAFGEFEMTPEQEAEMADQMLEMQRCLADLGFEIDLDGAAFELDPTIDFDEFEAAMDECAPEGVVSATGAAG